MGDTMSKEDFKNYVRNNHFIKESVDKGEITWQKAYEAFDLYGEQAQELIQLNKEIVPPEAALGSVPLASPPNSFLMSLASLDWNQISHAVDNLSRMVAMAKDVAGKDESKNEKGQQVFKRYND